MAIPVDPDTETLWLRLEAGSGMNNNKQLRLLDKIIFSPECCRLLFVESRDRVNVGELPRTPSGQQRRTVRLPAIDFRLIMVQGQHFT